MANSPRGLPDVTPQARALDALIQQAAEELIRSSHGSDPEGLLFVGTWHDAYPAILIRDPFLTDSAKVHLLYLMQEARRQPQAAIAMPSIENTAQVLGHSRGTVIRDRLLLRVSRWISLCQRVRDAAGRFRGNVHALHSEPCSLADATYLDDGYVKLLDEAETHYDPYVRRAGKAALAGIARDVAEGRDPLEQPDPIARRMESAAAVQDGSGVFFGSLFWNNGSPEGAETATRPVQNLDPVPGSNFERGRREPGSKFGPGNQVIEKPESSKFEPGERSSRSSNLKNTTTNYRQDAGSKFEPPPSLRWPSGFDDNLRRLVYHVLREKLPEQHHQDILDALAHKARDGRDPLRHPVKYAAELCRRVVSGEFHPVGDPDGTWKPPSKPLDTRMLELRNLRGEICALERLLSASPSAAVRSPLESQLAQLRARLREAECSAGRAQ